MGSPFQGKIGVNLTGTREIQGHVFFVIKVTGDDEKGHEVIDCLLQLMILF